MANTLRIKRRLTGDPGAPSSLKTAELAYNQVDDILYIGFGDDGAGNATSIKQIGGLGYFLTKNNAALTGVPTAPTAAPGTSTTQIATTAFVSAAVTGGSVADGDKGDITVSGSGSVWTIDDGAVTLEKLAELANARFLGRVTAGTGTVEALTATQMRTALAINNVDNTSDANKPISTATQSALDAKAPLNSPALTGTPTAPTATDGTNNTQLATTAFVHAAIAALIGSAPGVLDTLGEIADALNDDPNFATTITTALSQRLITTNNLSDLTDASAARTNLGLGTMATQSAATVAITGGTIDGVTLDGGTF